MRLLVSQFVAEGMTIPKGWGVSYRCWDKYGAVCHPVPFNLLVRWGRNVWFYVCGFHPSWADKRYERYFRIGFDAAMEACEKSRTKELSKAVDIIETLVNRAPLG